MSDIVFGILLAPTGRRKSKSEMLREYFSRNGRTTHFAPSFFAQDLLATNPTVCIDEINPALQDVQTVDLSVSH